MKKKIFLISFFLLTSCNNSSSIPIIKCEEMFEINKDKYYVLIYLNGCMACRDVKHRINMMEEEKRQIFYYLDLECNQKILSDNFVSNIGVNSYLNLKIKKTPTLLCIENKVVIDEYIKQDSIFSFLDVYEERDVD